MKILITGAAGFIGRNLKEGLEKYHKIAAPHHSELELLDDVKVLRYLKKQRFDIVIHCATHNATKTSNKDLSRVFYSNLLIFFNLARCNNFYGRMFYFGSGAEYDREHYRPQMKEEFFDSYVPKGDYGLSKYIMAKSIKSIPNIYNLRLFGCFGKYEDWRIRFISSVCCYALYHLPIKINQNAYFDYLYVNDLVGIIKLFITAKEIPYQNYNICTGRSIDLVTLTRMVIKVSGKNLPFKVAEKGFKPEYSGNNKRLLETIKKFEFTPIEKAIAELYRWYFTHKKQIDPKLLLT